jgi:hypothetical protein
MKKLFRLLFLVLLMLAVGLVAKDVSVKGYYRKDGTYVAPYHRTSPNNTKNDNYSTEGNINPYTGKPGTKPRDPPADAPAAPAQAAPSEAEKTPEAPANVSPAMTRKDRWHSLNSKMEAADVEKLLGKPETTEQATLLTWKYPDGEVVFANGHVLGWRQSSDSTADASERQ